VENPPPPNRRLGRAVIHGFPVTYHVWSVAHIVSVTHVVYTFITII